MRQHRAAILCSSVLAFACFASCVVSPHAQTPPTPQGYPDVAKRADAAYAARHYAEAAQLYAQAAELAPASDRSGVDYNEACSLALSGDKEGAFRVLAQSVDEGYVDAVHTAVDTDLMSLHDDARWKPLLACMAEVTAAQDRRFGTAGFKTAYTPNLSDADKLAGLSLLWSQARFGFANFWHVPQVNWDETYRAYIPQVLATHSTAEYYNVLERFYALLRDGHSGVWEPDALQHYWLPLHTSLVEGKVLVTGSLDPAFDMQGVRAGDELVSINGMAAKDWAAANVLPVLSASSPQDRDARLYGGYLFASVAGTHFQLVTRTPEGRQSEHTFAVKAKFYKLAPDFEFRILSGDVAYVALNEFGDNHDADEWDRHWPEISRAHALILDFRRNGGGSDNIGAHILATLIDKPVPSLLSESPEWVATYRAWGSTEPIERFPTPDLPPDPKHHFAGKVAVLTGPNTYSAAEDTVVVFAQSKRGLRVGEPTGGSTGQPLMMDLPGGGGARVCTKHDRFADGHEFVGVGVPPDVPAHLTRSDLINGTDSVIAAAVKALQGS